MNRQSNEQKHRIVFLGPPGAGKGTHARDLASALKLPHISTGDILREAVKKQTKVGLEAKAYMDKGELVPDEVIARVVLERLKEKDCSSGYILDGFPRTARQAELLGDVDFAIDVSASTDVIVARLAGRRVCKNCGATYHIKNIPSKVEGVCDRCQGPLYQRADDEEKTVRRRLEVYQEQSQSVLDYYKRKGVLRCVDGDLERKKAYDEIREIVETGSLI